MLPLVILAFISRSAVPISLLAVALVKVFAILSLTRFNLVYFSVNSTVIFIWLILGLHSLMSGLHILRVLRTFFLILLVQSQ